MITEDYVSFETAKLLKEKGFDGECRDYYSEDGHFYSEDFKSDWNHGGPGTIILFSAPTLQMAMKWLREVYNITIGITFSYGIISYEIQKNEEFITSIGSSRTYEKMVEEAIKYCLENLI